MNLYSHRIRLVASVLLASFTMLPALAAPKKAQDRVDLEMMTWVEVRDAIASGKTTALIFDGGSETRGPQAVIGGHTLVAHAKVIDIAKQLGNAIALPVLPYSPNNADPEIPGTIGISADTFKEVNREIAEQAIRNGFKNVVLMGDHGGGQQQLAEVAKELDAKYAPQGIRVVFCDDAYKKSNDDYDKYIESLGLPGSGHASINDTSEMMYAEGKDGDWIREDQLPNALGAPRGPRTPRPAGSGYGAAGSSAGASSAMASSPATPGAPPPMTPEVRAAAAGPRPPVGSGPGMRNGVSGDGRKSTAAIGKVGYDIHVREAVAQIRQLLGEPAGKS
jgi:creatinine amidohydrolase